MVFTTGEILLACHPDTEVLGARLKLFSKGLVPHHEVGFIRERQRPWAGHALIKSWIVKVAQGGAADKP